MESTCKTVPCCLSGASDVTFVTPKQQKWPHSGFCFRTRQTDTHHFNHIFKLGFIYESKKDICVHEMVRNKL